MAILPASPVKIVENFWRDMDAQRWGELPAYFADDARIDWPNTDEQFDVAGFAEVNHNYPGNWSITIRKLLCADDDTIVSVVQVQDGETSFHATSFFKFREGKIVSLDEYWGQDEPPPEWRKRK